MATIATNVGWCWFQDPRALVVGDKLYAGAVPGHSANTADVVIWNLSSRKGTRLVLHDDWASDDHNAPVFWKRGDGSVLAAMAKHGVENCFYTRVIFPDDTLGELKTHNVGVDSRITYQNLLYSEGRLYNFFRGLNGTNKPSYVWSEDEGESWHGARQLVDSELPRPYVKYALDEEGRIQFLYTKGHPIEGNHEVWWGVLSRKGVSVETVCQWPWARLWISDFVIAHGVPRVILTTRTDQGRNYYYGPIGNTWDFKRIITAGDSLCKGEDDYTGLAVINPTDPEEVVFSRGVRGIWSLYRLNTRTGDHAKIETNRNAIRPMFSFGDARLLLWLEGEYRHYTDYDLNLVTT